MMFPKRNETEKIQNVHKVCQMLEKGETVRKMREWFPYLLHFRSYPILYLSPGEQFRYNLNIVKIGLNFVSSGIGKMLGNLILEQRCESFHLFRFQLFNKLEINGYFNDHKRRFPVSSLMDSSGMKIHHPTGGEISLGKESVLWDHRLS